MKKLIIIASSAFIAILACLAVPPTGFASTAKTVSVTITKDGYVPNSATVAVGDSVQFTNSDTVAHQVSFKSTVGVSCTPNPLVLQPGQSGTCTFATAGSYSYSDPNVKGKTFRGSVVVGAQPGGGPPAAVSVTLAVKPQILVYGGKVTLSGSLANQKLGENVEILAQPCGQASATKIATAVTTSGGAFTAQVQPLQKTIYTVKVKNATSNAVTVKVRPRIRLGKIAPHRYSVRVFAAASFAGKYGSFQRYSVSLRRWVTVRSVLLRRNTSGVAPTVLSSATFRSRVKARLKVRVVLPQAQVGSCYLAGRSNVTFS